MSYSAHYEGGLNTISRVFPAGTTSGHLVGKMPKNGKIVRVRYSGRAAETGLSAVMRARTLDGTGVEILTLSTDISFATVAAAYVGVEATFLSTAQAHRDAKDNQALDVLFTGTTVGEVLVEVSFEPRP